jgi:peptidoglycan/xylan/chitin deacetylase (PgdA/CDA1 family)
MRTHDVVSLEAILVSGAPSSRPRVAITFDDAYAGALTAGLEALAQRRLPATIFVTPALLGDHTWWDILADPATGTVEFPMRQHALNELRGDRHSVAKWAASLGRTVTPPDYLRIGTEAQLRHASRQPGISLQSHTWSHRNLKAVGPDDLIIELARPVQWLEENIGIRPRFISYPYGLHSPQVIQATEAAGYDAAFRVDGGWLAPTDRHRYAIPRFNVPAGLSLDGLRIRLAGIGAGG